MSTKQPLIGMPLLVGNLYLGHACGDTRFTEELMLDLTFRDLTFLHGKLREMAAAVADEIQRRAADKEQER